MISAIMILNGFNFNGSLKMSELSIDVNGLSYHAGGGSEFRQVNPGFGLRYQQAKNGTLLSIIAGRYLNSLNRRTDYLLVGKGWPLSHNVSAGIVGGYLTGYSSKPIAGIFPYVRGGPIVLTMAPPTEYNPAVIAMSITIKIGDL